MGEVDRADRFVADIEDLIFEHIPEDDELEYEDDEVASLTIPDEPARQWGYTPEGARAELRAWKNFIRHGNKRAFEPRLLRGDIADFIEAELKAGKIEPLLVLDMALKRIPAGGIDDLYPTWQGFVKTLDFIDAPHTFKLVASIRQDFEKQFNAVLDAMRDGSLDSRAKAGNILRQIIRIFGYRVFLQGMQDGGVDEEPDDSDAGWIESAIAQQSKFISDFTETLLKGGGISDAQSDNRAALWWTGSIMPFYTRGLHSAAGNAMMEFGGEDGEESCDDCQRLKGQRHRFNEWQRRNLDIPHIGQSTFCAGWKCLHRLIPVASKARGSW